VDNSSSCFIFAANRVSEDKVLDAFRDIVMARPERPKGQRCDGSSS